MAKGRRQTFEIAGAQHGSPIPMGARVDNIVFSSGIQGTDPATGKRPASGEEEVQFAFANMLEFLEVAGVTVDDVVRLTIHLGDSTLRDAINVEWLKIYPEPEDRPARHAMNLKLNGDMRIQLEVFAVA
jgi:2-iminobutanoate/2-iminopropanoate deaminase